MKWQDIVLSVGNFMLAGALIPSVLSQNKPDPLTSSITFLILVSFGAAFATLRLRLSTFAVCTSALMWLTLFVQEVI